MILRIAFSDLPHSQVDESEESARPTGEDAPMSIGKNKRRRYVSPHRHSGSPSLTIGALGRENVGIRVTLMSLSRAFDLGMGYAPVDATPL